MKIKDKKTARAAIAEARTALQILNGIQQTLFEWGDEQELSDAESPGEEAWTAVECLGDSLETVKSALDDLDEALN